MSNDDCVEAWRALLQAENVVLRKIEADMQRAGVIALTWYDVLLELNAVPGRRLRMQDLAARTVLSRTRVSRLVDELQAQDLVVREPDPADGRVSFAVLTATGRSSLKVAAPIYLAGIKAHFTDHLTTTERSHITSALGKVIASHQQPLEPKRP